MEYYYRVCVSEYCLGNYTNSIKFGKKGLAIDSTHVYILGYLGLNYMFLGQHEKALKYFNRPLLKRSKYLATSTAVYHRAGYIYLKNGLNAEAERFFNLHINNCIRTLELVGSARQPELYYDLACVYAFKREKDKALENLTNFNKRPIMDLHMVTLIKNDPLLDNIRDEPEFKQIVMDMEAKYLAERDQVSKWLKEQGM